MSLTSELSAVFDKPLKKLTPRQLELVSSHIVDWGKLTPKERRERAANVDRQRATFERIRLARYERKATEALAITKDNGYSVGWFDATLNADSHFKLPDVSPVNAAMLMCQYDPQVESFVSATNCTNDAIGPIDLKLLAAHFEALSRTEPQHRTLLDWWCVARDAGMKHHPWIKQYISETGLDAPSYDSQAVPFVEAQAPGTTAV